MILQCKCCGGDLTVHENTSIGTCDYCGTTMTIPKVDDEKKLNLFNRANHLRMKSEFDSAMVVYENIIAEDKKNAEAYWGICLCKYGIEYVTDPESDKKIPTCHRSSYTSILQDENFAYAMEYADSVAQSVYKEEASEIARIQKQLLEISAKEEPYDIFICYKESDEAGNRTKDSVLAQEIYYELIKKDYRVFFSRITLEKKLGKEYEPYIFSALNSSKIMIVAGTCAQNMNAPWVKNEWNRFIALMQDRTEKALIPVYQDMSPYDMPEEFSNLQALNMSRLGFMQDLLEGISKLLPKKETTTTDSVQEHTDANITPLLQRSMIFLEDQEWKKADSYAERILDHDPYCADAYLVKMLSIPQLPNVQSLASRQETFDSLDEYKKIMKYGDTTLVQQISGYNQAIIDRIKQQEEEKRKQAEEEKRRREEEKQRLAEQEKRKRQTEEAIRAAKREQKRREEKELWEKIKNDYLQDYQEQCKGIDESIDQLTSEISHLSAEFPQLERQLRNAKASVAVKYFLVNLIAVLVFPGIILLFVHLTDGLSNLDTAELFGIYAVTVVIVAIGNLAYKGSEDSGGNALVTKICKLFNMGNISTLERNFSHCKYSLSGDRKRLHELQLKRQTLEQEKNKKYSED